jgi:hypothetical protein
MVMRDLSICGQRVSGVHLGDLYQNVLDGFENRVNVNDDVYSGSQSNTKALSYQDIIAYRSIIVNRSVYLEFYQDTLRSVSVYNQGPDIESTLEFIKDQFRQCGLEIEGNESDTVYYKLIDERHYFSIYKIRYTDKEAIAYLYTYLDY